MGRYLLQRLAQGLLVLWAALDTLIYSAAITARRCGDD